jgi:hypothetical protein
MYSHQQNETKKEMAETIIIVLIFGLPYIFIDASRPMTAPTIVPRRPYRKRTEVRFMITLQ